MGRITHRVTGWITLACAAVALGAAPTAQASFSNVPADTWVTNGQVQAVAVAGDHVFLGGSFSRVGPNTGQGVGLDPSSGATLGGDRISGRVDVAIPDGDGGEYVGGSFTRVGSVARAGVVHLLSSGGLDPAFEADVSGSGATIYALALSGGSLYLGGDFAAVNGTSESGAAKVDASSGAVDHGFSASADGPVRALAVSGSELYLGGQFGRINGISDANLAAVSTSDGALDTGNQASADSYVTALQAVGGDVYVGGNFGTLDGTSSPYLGALTASNGALDGGFAAADNATNGRVLALATVGHRLYLGGDFTRVGSGGSGGESDGSVAVIDTTNGNVAPGFNAPADGTVQALAVSAGAVYAGGGFSHISGAARNGLAELDPASGTPVPGFDPDPDAEVDALALSGSRLFAGGQFGIVGGLARANLAALELSDGTGDAGFSADTDGIVRALVVSGSQLYVGGAFGHLHGTVENQLASVSTTDGTPSAAFHGGTDMSSDGIHALAVSDSRLYAGGAFAAAGGLGRTRLVSEALDTGAADPGFRADLDNLPYALAVGDGHLYVSGPFGHVNGTAAGPLVAVDPGSGALDTGFAPASDLASSTVPSALVVSGTHLYFGGYSGISFNGSQYGAAELDGDSGAYQPFNPHLSNYATVDALALSDSQVILGGSFGSAGGDPRNGLAAVDATSGDDDPAFGPRPDDAVLSLGASATALYVGGQFTHVGGVDQPSFAQFGAGAAAGAPVNVAAPAISGTAQRGQTLIANHGTWTNSPASYRYQWRRCSSTGTGCSDIDGAAASTYGPGADDVGHTLVVRVIAHNAAGDSDAVDAPHSAVVADASSANAPTVSTGGTESVNGAGATLDATVDPQGEPTTYHFEYGTSPTYGHASPAYDAGSGTANEAVNGDVVNLQPSTTYHYRVIATNASGSATGTDATFTTAATAGGGGGGASAPTVSTGGVGGVTPTSATLLALVNPHGQLTSWHFDFGTTTAYGASGSPTADQDAGSGSDDTVQAADITGLAPDTVYHYRVVAQNATGPATGVDRTFRTAPASSTTTSTTTAAQTTTINQTTTVVQSTTVAQTTGAATAPSAPAHTVAASATPAGGGTVRLSSPTTGAKCGSGSCLIPDDGTVVVAATPKSPETFHAWTGACAGQGQSCTLAHVHADQSTVAEFGAAASKTPGFVAPSSTHVSTEYHAASSAHYSSGAACTGQSCQPIANVPAGQCVDAIGGNPELAITASCLKKVALSNPARFIATGPVSLNGVAFNPSANSNLSVTETPHPDGDTFTVAGGTDDVTFEGVTLDRGDVSWTVAAAQGGAQYLVAAADGLNIDNPLPVPSGSVFNGLPVDSITWPTFANGKALIDIAPKLPDELGNATSDLLPLTNGDYASAIANVGQEFGLPFTTAEDEASNCGLARDAPLPTGTHALHLHWNDIDLGGGAALHNVDLALDGLNHFVAQARATLPLPGLSGASSNSGLSGVLEVKDSHLRFACIGAVFNPFYKPVSDIPLTFKHVELGLLKTHGVVIEGGIGVSIGDNVPVINNPPFDADPITFGLHIPAAGSSDVFGFHLAGAAHFYGVNIGSMAIDYYAYPAVHAQVDIPYLPIAGVINGHNLNATFDYQSSGWLLTASGALNMDGFDIASGTMLVSNRGVGACGTIGSGPLSASADIGYQWGGSFIIGLGCDDINGLYPPLTPTCASIRTALAGAQAIDKTYGVQNDPLPALYQGILDNHTCLETGSGASVHTTRATVAAASATKPAAAGTTVPTEVQHAGHVRFLFTSRSGTPSVTLIGPGERRVQTPTSGTATGDRHSSGFRLPSGHSTVLDVNSAAAGAWLVEVNAGSPTVVAIRTATVVGHPRLRAKLTTIRGSRRRILHYTFTPRSGQQLVFRETGRASGKTLGTVDGARARGTIAFFPSNGPAGTRTITATLTRDGIPRAKLTVLHFRAGPPALPGRVRALKIRVTGHRALVGFAPVAGAATYRVTVHLSDGRRFTAMLRATRVLRVAVGNIPGGAIKIAVSVRGVDAVGRAGATASVRRTIRLYDPRKHTIAARRSSRKPR